MGGRVAIAATGPVSLAAGREVALAGGNAVDVAVAAALAAMSTEPGIVSLAGGAFVSVWPAAGDPVVIDGNVEMPGRGAARRPVRRRGARGRHRLRRRGDDCSPGTARSPPPAPSPRRELAAEECGALSWAASWRRRPAPAATATRRCVRPRATSPSWRTPSSADDPEAFRRGDPRRRVGGRRAGRRSSPTTPSPTCSTWWPARGRRCSPPARSAGRWSTTWPPTGASSPTATSRSTRRWCAPGAPHRRRAGTSPSTRRRRWAARCSP